MGAVWSCKKVKKDCKFRQLINKVNLKGKEALKSSTRAIEHTEYLQERDIHVPAVDQESLKAFIYPLQDICFKAEEAKRALESMQNMAQECMKQYTLAIIEDQQAQFDLFNN